MKKEKNKKVNKKVKKIGFFKDKDRLISLCQSISKYSLYLLVFLVPIFFLPWTSNILDFSKQSLAGILVFISLISWLLKSLFQEKLKVSWSILHLPIVILLFITWLSTITSFYSYGSFWGSPLPVSQSFLSLLIFSIFSFLVVNVFEDDKGEREIRKMICLFFFSGLLAGLFAIFQLFEPIKTLISDNSLPMNIFGSINSISIFLSILLPLIIVSALARKGFVKILSMIGVFIILISIFIINFGLGFFVLIAGMSGLFIFGLMKIKNTSKRGWVFLPLSLIVLGLIFSFLNVSLIKVSIPTEVLPSYRSELSIIGQGLKGNILLGTGPGTFSHSFSKFKSLELNQTIFWNLRFNRGSSEFLDKILTTGILGMLAWLAVMSMFLWFALKLACSSNSRFLCGVFASLLACTVAQLLFPVNFSILLFLWMLFGTIAFKTRKTKEWELEQGSLRVAGFGFLLLLVFILGVIMIFTGSRRYLAETKFNIAVTQWAKQETDQAIINLTESIILSPENDVYWRNISQLYLVKLNSFIREEQTLESEEVSNQARILVSNLVDSAKKATDINPKGVANWNVRGFVYRNMIGGLDGAKDWAIISYNKALELDPNNPYIYTELGKIYLASDEINKAIKEFDRALELKPGYVPALFQKAAIYDNQGKIKDAIMEIREARKVAPLDVDLIFQLGLLYWKLEKVDMAEDNFNQAIELDPDYLNAHYFLGLVYDSQGKTEEALNEFERVLELNPSYENINTILDNLRKGKQALEEEKQEEDLLDDEEKEE